ncbi:MAG: hypothetical protein H6739_26250 [Alphaproteobacteria bacterium]|nr:hypothetical protein [Alphaproteobacteria bacterium]
MKLLRQIRLQLTDGRSDKVYEVDLVELSPDRCVVNFRYGRRGAALRDGSKTVLPVAQAEAQGIFDKLVQSKTVKGYVEVGRVGASPPPPPPAPASAGRLSPQARAILAYLRDPSRVSRRWPLSRIAWRAGELRLVDAIPPLDGLIAGADPTLLTSIAWALARCAPDPGPHRDALRAALTRIRDDAKASGPARRYAEEGLRTLEPERWIARLLGRLPAALAPTASRDDPAAFNRVLRVFLADPDPTDAAALELLYSLDTPAVRPVLVTLLAELPLAPPFFKPLRHIFKLAELRDDGPVFAALTRRFETSRPMFSGSRWWRYAHVQGIGRIEPQKELSRPDARIAFSAGTKRYLRRRSWRSLRWRGELGLESYAPMAAAMLLAFSDDDGRDPRTRYRWNWATRQNEALTYDRFTSFWAFNHILFVNSARFEVSERSFVWAMKPGHAPTDPTPTAREEAFPALWDAAPAALVQLLEQSRCAPVHGFAARALRANPGGWVHLTNASLKRLLDSPYPDTAALAADIAVERFDPSNPDIELVVTLLGCAHDRARRAAQGWLRADPRRLLAEPAVAVAVALSVQADTRALGPGLFADAFLPDDRAKAVALAIVDAIAALPADDADALTRGRSACSLLEGALARALSRLDDALLFRLAEGDHPLTQELAARALSDRADLPDTLLAAWMTSPHAPVRAIGMACFGRLPDHVLLDRYAVLVHLAANPHPDLRAQARPLIQRLALGRPAFADSMVSALIGILGQAEPAEGLHADLVDLLRGPLADALPRLDSQALFRLLDSPSTVAHELAGQRMAVQLNPADLSVRQLVTLADHDVLAVRRAGQGFLDRSVDRLRAEPEDALRALEAGWPDAQAHAFGLFRDRFDDLQLAPEHLIAICDSVKPAVQTFGREMILRAADTEHGRLYLRRLSQHPAVNVQLFATHYLDNASGDLDQLRQLMPFFRVVFGQVNKARLPRARVQRFLEAEALQDADAAALIAELLSDVSMSTAIGERAWAVGLMARLRHQHPGLDLPLRARDPEFRGARAL